MQHFFRTHALGFLAAIALLPLGQAPARAAEATVFTAASLTDVMQKLADDFQAGTDNALTLAPGSSATLSTQIMAGAPADLFISANEIYADRVADADGALSFELFGNALAIIAPEGFEGTMTLDELPDGLGSGRLAVGDPASVPAGIYAKQALVNAGLWKRLRHRLAPGGDVRAAVNFVARGAAPFGIVYKTDAAVPGVKIVGAVPNDLHAPIRYWAVLLQPENRAAAAFLSYVRSDPAWAVLEAAGFTHPDAAR